MPEAELPEDLTSITEAGLARAQVCGLQVYAQGPGNLRTR